MLARVTLLRLSQRSKCISTQTALPGFSRNLSAISRQEGVIETDVPHYTIPPSCYYEPSHHEIEKEAIFEKSWQLAGHVNALVPTVGSVAEVSVAGQSIVLTRGSDSVSAYHNVCPHRAHELVQPGEKRQMKSKVLTCPNHGWSFKATDGKLVKARFSENVPDFCSKDFSLFAVPVKEVRGLVFINLDTSDNIADFEDTFGSGFDQLLSEKIPGLDSADMKQLAVKEKVVNANWKVLVDNFLECYHCDIAHKAFVDMVDLNNYATYLNKQHIMFEATCKPDNKAYSFDKDDLLQTAFFCWIWPYNVVYSAPGSPNMSILQFIPISPTQTLRRSERFAMIDTSSTSSGDGAAESESTASDAEEAALARVAYLNQVLLEEDTGICESVQRGLKSKAYKGGRLMVSKGGEMEQKWHTEIAVAHFHQLLRKSCNIP
jgi:phenylpropionate dioxygenase-like ring-hydroxylating dioxygenase large terminal subunit